MAKRKGESGTLETAAEVNSARKELHESNLALAALTNEMILKRRSVIFQSVTALLDSRLEMAEREAEELKAIREHLLHLAESKVMTEEQFLAHSESSKQQIQQLQQVKEAINAYLTC